MATGNFKLEDVAFIGGGNMEESGKCQIVKRFLYEIIDNSAAARRRAILDLETLVPMKGACMAEDARYTLQSAQWNCLDWRNMSVKFYIDATYRRVSDDDAASAPWNLAPFNVSYSSIEQEIPFRLAYNSHNKKCVPVVNGAGDPLDAATKELIPQTSFSYYAEDYDLDNVLDFSNTVNNRSMRLLGRKYKAGTLFLLPFSVTALVTYDDDGYTEKWKYYQIDMTFRYRKDGWTRELLNVGNRARFGSSNVPELIFQYYAFNFGRKAFETTPVLSSAATYYAHNAVYKAWLADSGMKSSLPANVPYEYGENIPLTDSGAVNTKVFYADVANKNFSGYPTRTYNEFETVSWTGLNLPSEIRKKWNS